MAGNVVSSESPAIALAAQELCFRRLGVARCSTGLSGRQTASHLFVLYFRARCQRRLRLPCREGLVEESGTLSDRGPTGLSPRRGPAVIDMQPSLAAGRSAVEGIRDAFNVRTAGEIIPR